MVPRSPDNRGCTVYGNALADDMLVATEIFFSKWLISSSFTIKF